jgi:hypothetical protein
MDEIENCFTVTLTSKTEWNPYFETYNDNEISNENKKISVKVLISQHRDTNDDFMASLLKINKVNTEKKKLFMNEEQLARIWAIPQSVAHDTIKSTTQLFIRSKIHLIERRYRTKNAMLRYNQLNCKMYSDTFFSNCNQFMETKVPNFL